MTNNLFENLMIVAAGTPDKIALIEPTASDLHLPKEWTYAQLVFEVRNRTESLGSLKLEPGSRVGIILRPTLDFYALALACFALGLTPVFFNSKTTSLPHNLRTSEVDFATITNSFFEPEFWTLFSKQRLFTTIKSLPFIKKLTTSLNAENREQQKYYEYQPTDIVYAMIGNEGHSLEVSFKTHEAQREVMTTALRSQMSDVDFIFSPLLILQNLFQGLTSLIAPNEEVTSLRNIPVTRIKGTAAQIKNLGKSLRQGHCAILSLRSIIVEGQRLSQKEAGQIEHLFPNTEIFHCFGISEIEPLALISISEIRKSPAVGYVVGHAIDSVKIEIVTPEIDLRNTNLVNHRSQEGEVIISARHLADHKGEFSTFTDAFGNAWVQTGILGYFGPDKNLYLIGHLAEQIKIDGRKYPVELIEQQFETIPGVEKASLKHNNEQPHLHVTLAEEAKNDEVTAAIEKYGLDFKLKNLQIHSESLQKNTGDATPELADESART